MEKKVVVYSTPTSPYCKKVRKFLDEAGVFFQDFDVSTDKTARGEMVRKTGKMVVPVVEIDGSFVVGFTEGELREKLNL